MRKITYWFGLPVVLSTLLFYVVLIPKDSIHDDFGSYELSSTASRAPYGSIEPLKKKFVDDVASKMTQDELMDGSKLTDILATYNDSVAPKLNTEEDSIDALLGILPESYRRHFSMIHRSFSIQSAKPMAPRVILYGTDAKVMMTFNGGHDFEGQPMAGGDSIEVIEWNTQKKTWDFSEITFDLQKRAVHNTNPQKCVMCHAGTPKPVHSESLHLYKDKLKPIFPQYPFWPGFYGSVNDIVGVNTKGTKDTIMLDLRSTLAQVSGLTFGDTEELFRLKKLLDENPKYLDVVKNELDVHSTYFQKFMDSAKTRSRYKHLVTLNELYTNKNQPVPEFLKAAPFRRTFDKEYGHYLLRPNFYLSSLMTFYHSQFIAKEIESFPAYHQMKHSFLARKYNCSNIQVNGFKLSDLDPSFDLLYPNLSTADSRDRQYLLAYQYNVEASAKKIRQSLPLHAWNLESNEDIASYHYGNVFSDLNELVLWQLARRAFPQLSHQNSRDAAESRHYELPNSNFLRSFLLNAGGLVSKMGQPQFDFAMKLSPYYSTAAKFKALPVSSYCDSVFLPAARIELQELAPLQATKQLPHQIFTLDPRLYQISDIIDPGHRPGLNMVRQACEGCHTADSNTSRVEIIKPQFNVDWFSPTYFSDIKQPYRYHNQPQKDASSLKDALVAALAKSTLPVPYGNSMPYARRPMDDFSLRCELLIVENNYESDVVLKGKSFGCDRANDPNSFGCRCQKLSREKEKLHNELYGTKVMLPPESNRN